MRLLLVTFGFPPWGGPSALRASRLWEYGVTKGWDVTVLCGAQECAHVFDDTDIVPAFVEAECVRVSDGTDYRLRPTLLRSIGFRPTRLVDKMLGAGIEKWVRSTLSLAESFDHQPPDLICSTSPPIEVDEIASVLAQRWKIPWVADYRDPPWENPSSQRLLGQSLDHCCTASFNTPKATEFAKQNWPQHAGKMLTATNGVDADVIQFCEAEQITPGVVYAGGLYPSLIDSVRRISQSQDVHVYTFAEGKRKRQLGQLKRIPRVQLHDPVPHAQYLAMLRRYEAILVEHPSTYQYRIPLKTYSAVASGRPVILAGQTQSSQAMLAELPGIYIGSHDHPALLDDADWQDISRWNARAMWSARAKWLEQHTWRRQFEQMFSQVRQVKMAAHQVHDV